MYLQVRGKWVIKSSNKRCHIFDHFCCYRMWLKRRNLTPLNVKWLINYQKRKCSYGMHCCVYENVKCEKSLRNTTYSSNYVKQEDFSSNFFDCFENWWWWKRSSENAIYNVLSNKCCHLSIENWTNAKMNFNLSMFEYSQFKSSYFKLPRMSYEAFKINFAFWIPTKLQQQHLSEHFHLNKGVIRCIHTSLCMKGLVDILLEINLRKMLKQKRSLQISSMVTHVFYAV